MALEPSSGPRRGLRGEQTARAPQGQTSRANLQQQHHVAASGSSPTLTTSRPGPLVCMDPGLVAFGLNKSQVFRSCKRRGYFNTDELLEGTGRKPKSDVTVFVLQETEKEAHQNLGGSCGGGWADNNFSSLLLGHSALSYLPYTASRPGGQSGRLGPQNRNPQLKLASTIMNHYLTRWSPRLACAGPSLARPPGRP